MKTFLIIIAVSLFLNMPLATQSFASGLFFPPPPKIKRDKKIKSSSIGEQGSVTEEKQDGNQDPSKKDKSH